MHIPHIDRVEKVYHVGADESQARTLALPRAGQMAEHLVVPVGAVVDAVARVVGVHARPGAPASVNNQNKKG